MHVFFSAMHCMPSACKQCASIIHETHAKRFIALNTQCTTQQDALKNTRISIFHPMTNVARDTPSMVNLYNFFCNGKFTATIST